MLIKICDLCKSEIPKNEDWSVKIFRDSILTDFKWDVCNSCIDNFIRIAKEEQQNAAAAVSE